MCLPWVSRWWVPSKLGAHSTLRTDDTTGWACAERAMLAHSAQRQEWPAGNMGAEGA